MATDVQRSYIKDLSVLKLKEFKEFKEMLYANAVSYTHLTLPTIYSV